MNNMLRWSQKKLRSSKNQLSGVLWTKNLKNMDKLAGEIHFVSESCYLYHLQVSQGHVHIEGSNRDSGRYQTNTHTHSSNLFSHVRLQGQVEASQPSLQSPSQSSPSQMIPFTFKYTGLGGGHIFNVPNYQTKLLKLGKQLGTLHNFWLSSLCRGHSEIGWSPKGIQQGLTKIEGRKGYGNHPNSKGWELKNWYRM